MTRAVLSVRLRSDQLREGASCLCAHRERQGRDLGAVPVRPRVADGAV